MPGLFFVYVDGGKSNISQNKPGGILRFSTAL
jgi:hypothetical protein